MISKLHLLRGAAVLACAGSLAGTAAVVAPSAASAAGATKCANKNLTIKPESGGTIHIPVKAITVEGTTCAEAYKVIGESLTGKPTGAWKVSVGKWKAPEGLVPEVAKKGSAKIQFAVQGG